VTPQPFGRSILWWLTAATLVFACSFCLITRDNSKYREPDVTGPSTHSRSAIGYAALYRLLQKLEVPVAQLQHVGALPDSADVLVIAEPGNDPTELATVKAWLASSERTLLILPKRRGSPDRSNPAYLGYNWQVPISNVLAVLQLVDPDATVARVATPGLWEPADTFTELPTVRQPQLIRSERLVPLVSGPDGMLVGEIYVAGRRVIVAADPDPFGNRDEGLGAGSNAAFAVHLLQALRDGQGSVVFAESLHGFTTTQGHPAALLLQWPFILVTLQIGLACVLLLWASVGRVGAPARLPAPLGTGKASLIGNGARLLLSGGHLGFVARRYAEAVIRDVALRLHVSRAIAPADLREWFAQRGHPLPPDRGLHSPRDALLAALDIFRWRVAVLDAFRQRTKSR
jgi:hypothetical protein